MKEGQEEKGGRRRSRSSKSQRRSSNRSKRNSRRLLYPNFLIALLQLSSRFKVSTRNPGSFQIIHITGVGETSLRWRRPRQTRLERIFCLFDPMTERSVGTFSLRFLVTGD